MNRLIFKFNNNYVAQFYKMTISSAFFILMFKNEEEKLNQQKKWIKMGKQKCPG